MTPPSQHPATQSVTTFGDLLLSAVARNPRRDAIVFPHEKVSFEVLYDRAVAAAGAMIEAGLESGDAVGILMPNCIDNAVLIFAATLVGVICVPVNSRYQERELRHVVADAQIKMLFTSDLVADHVDFVERLSRAFPDLEDFGADRPLALSEAPQLQHIIMVGHRRPTGMVNFEDFLKRDKGNSSDVVRTRAAAVSGDSPAVMLYTSGTTSMPKGCPLTHRQFVSAGRCIAQRLGLENDDRLWDALPMFHASGLLPMLAAFHVGVTYFSQVHFDPTQALTILSAARITVAWPAYTTIWQPIITAADFEPGMLAELRVILCVGPPATLQVMEQALPTAAVVGCYGITEGSGVSVMADARDPPEIRTGTCGLPFDGLEIEIRDPQSGRRLEPGVRGALCLRGMYVIDAYWHDAAKTAEAFDGDRWFDTGDLASLDPTGRVLFHGRLKDTLKVGGENVAAVEVEAFLTTHPAVKLAAVVGIPNPRYGEVPAAFVELRPGENETEESLISFCQQRIAAFKVPRHIRFVTDWPMSATKIRKDELRLSLLSELELADPP